MHTIKGTPWNEFKKKVRVYDVETKTLIGEFESVMAAARHLGISNSTVWCAIKHKYRNRSNNLGKVLAFR